VFPIFENIVYGLGIFLGPLFGARPGSNFEVFSFIESYLVFILTMVCWVGFEKSFSFFLFQTNQKGNSSSKTLIQGLAVFTSCLIFLGVLHSFKVRNEHFVAILMLGAIASRIIRIISRYLQTYWTFFFGIFLETTVVGALSFFVLTQKPTWQPLLIGAGFGFMRVAISLSKNLASGSKILLANPRFWAAIFSLALFLGPILWASMAFAGHLPKQYAVLLALLIPLSKVPYRFREAIQLVEEDRIAEATNTYESCITFAILMVLLSSIVSLPLW
jgi:hypothetical protein